MNTHFPTKRYLGDAVYVDYDGYHIVLTTEDGISETNRICLEQEVYANLISFVSDLMQSIKEMQLRLNAKS